MTQNLLVVDDEEAICWGLQKIGRELNCTVYVAPSAEDALNIAESETLDAIITDVCLPGISGLAAIASYRIRFPRIPIIVMTAYGDLKTAVEAVRQGAFEYLVKPFSAETVRNVLRRALDDANQNRVEIEPSGNAAVEGFVAESTIMQEAFNRIALAAASDASVLISGESGTGKELAAQAIHKFSSRASGPFVSVNLAALSPTLAESELFGHTKGAYTGADTSRTGLLVQADKGTLFLDEVADIPMPIQVKLLRALETHEVTPVGGSQPISTQFRIIAASHRDLNQMIQQSLFRHDLFYRLAGFQIELPPLRERLEDIEPLAKHFLDLLANHPQTSQRLSAAAIAEMKRRPWWGNVRELRNALQHAIIVARGSTIDATHLPPAIRQSASGTNDDGLASTIEQLLVAWTLQHLNESPECEDLYDRLLKLVEPAVFNKVMELNQNQYLTAAKVLGLHRTTLKKKLDG